MDLSCVCLPFPSGIFCAAQSRSLTPAFDSTGLGHVAALSHHLPSIHMCFYMVILMVTAPREDQGRSGSTTSVKTVPTWTFYYTRLLDSLRTGRHGGTLFSIWATNTRCHCHRRNSDKSK